MTADQLESVVAATGVERLRWLTSDANPDHRSREGYRRIVRERAEALAGGRATPAAPDHVAGAGEMVPLAASMWAMREGGRNCPHGGPARCGCSGMAWCKLMRRDVSMRDCLACLTTGARAGEGR